MRALLILLGILLVSCQVVSSDPIIQTQDRNPDLVKLIQQNRYDVLPVSQNEKSILNSVIPKEKGQMMRSIVILKENERIAAAFWYRHRHVARHMEKATEILFDAGGDLTDIVDREFTYEGSVPIDYLAVSNSAFLSERIIIVRIRDELYEFHVSEEHEATMQELILKIGEK